MRTVKILANETSATRVLVRYNASYAEYVVGVFHNNIHRREADYFTDDYQDALDTARMMLDEADRNRLNHN